jgi:hypothetical protein
MASVAYILPLVYYILAAVSTVLGPIAFIFPAVAYIFGPICRLTVAGGGRQKEKEQAANNGHA